jgi:hypothetical protein
MPETVEHGFGISLRVRRRYCDDDECGCNPTSQICHKNLLKQGRGDVADTVSLLGIPAVWQGWLAVVVLR